MLGARVAKTGCTTWVLGPNTTSGTELGRDITAPDWMMAGPPGVSVWDLMINCDDKLVVTTDGPIPVITGGGWTTVGTGAGLTGGCWTGTAPGGVSNGGPPAFKTYQEPQQHTSYGTRKSP